MELTTLPKRENVSFSQIKTRSMPFLKHLFVLYPSAEKIIYVLNHPVDTTQFDYWRFRDSERPEFGWIVKVPRDDDGRRNWRVQMITWYCTNPEEVFKHFSDIGELIEMVPEIATQVTEINPDVEDRIYLNTWIGYGKNYTLVPYGLAKANQHLIRKARKAK